MEDNTQETEHIDAGEPVIDPIESNTVVTHHFAEANAKLNSVRAECAKVVVGHGEILDLMLACIICDGHILLEGVPGIAKTLTAKVLAKTIDAGFSRIQFTPDLMPADIIGTSVYNMKDSTFHFKRGPIFSNIILIDEINRAPAKTQSALFEVMEERQITFDGETYLMDNPFLVIATQNPIEQEGTYRLPEAQLDRFMIKLKMDYPDIYGEVAILNRFNTNSHIDLSGISAIISNHDIRTIQHQLNDVYIEPHIIEYIATVVRNTRNHVNIMLGASPRASLAMMRLAKVIAMMSERSFVIPDDVQFVAPHVLNHRIILTPEADMRNISPYDVVADIIKRIEVPR
jgi:MoxR-like ATPase